MRAFQNLVALVALLGIAGTAVPAYHLATNGWIGLASAVGIGGLVLSLGLAFLVGSPLSEERDLLHALGLEILSLVAGIIGSFFVPTVAPWQDMTVAVPMLLVAAAVSVRVLVRAHVPDLARLPTGEVVRRALGSDAVAAAAPAALRGRADAVAELAKALPLARDVARARILGLLRDLGPLDPSRAIPAVIAALRDAKGVEVEASAAAAQALAHPDLIEGLRALAPSGREAELAVLRARAACADVAILDAIGDVERGWALEIVRLLGAAALPELRKRLEAPRGEPEVVKALAALRALKGSGEAFELAARRAREGSPAVRAAALEALAWIDARRARPIAQEAVKDPDPAVHEQAMNILQAP